MTHQRVSVNGGRAVSDKAGTRFNDQQRFIERSEAMSVKHCACCGRFVSEPCARTYIDGWHYFCRTCENSDKWAQKVDEIFERNGHYDKQKSDAA